MPRIEQGPAEGTGFTPEQEEEKQTTRLFDKSGREYVPVSEAAKRTDLSENRIRGLLFEKRISGFKPGGRDLLLRWDTITKYIESGRKKGGRPRKKRPET